MDLHTLSKATTSSTSNSQRRHTNSADYISIIRGCHVRFPESRHYYEQLIQYLGSTATSRVASPLQEPKVFELDSIGEQCCKPYPYFPFRPRNSDEGAPSSSLPRVAVTVLEGFASPDCVASLGSRLSVRPELFLGNLHLDRRHSARGLRNNCELPAPPALQDNVVHIRLISLVKSLTDSGAMEISAPERQSWQKKCRQSEMELFNEKKHGVARFRELHVHNSSFFSVEQMVSFTVCKDMYGRWECLYLSDNGRSFKEDSHFPWSGCKPTTGRPLGSMPILAYNFPFNPQFPDMTDLDELASTLDQFHPLKGVVIANDLDAELLVSDPFFLLSKVLHVAILAWGQVIDFLAKDISHYKSGAPDDPKIALEQLRFDAGLLDRIEGFLSDNLCLIRQGGSPSWPRPTKTATAVLAHKENIQAELEVEVRHLIGRCTRLAKSCQLSTDFLVSSMQLREAQKGIAQAKQVQQLTQLAFLFIPISLLAALFSMNVSEFNNPPSIWVFFLAASVIFSVTCLFLSRHWWMRQIGRFQRVESKWTD